MSQIFAPYLPTIKKPPKRDVLKVSVIQNISIYFEDDPEDGPAIASRIVVSASIFFIL